MADKISKDSKLYKHVEQMMTDYRRRLSRGMSKAQLKSGILDDLLGAAKYEALQTKTLEDADQAFLRGLAAKSDALRQENDARYLDWANARGEMQRMTQALGRTDEAQMRKQLWGRGAPTHGFPTEDEIAEADEALSRHLYKPAYTSHGDALSGAVKEWGPDFLSFGALPMSIAASIGEYAFDRPESSPMTEATDAWKRVLGSSALPRAPGEYDLTEMAARVLSPLNFVGAGTMAKASKIGETLQRNMPDAGTMAKFGGLGALAYGSEDAEAAPFRFLTPERLAKLVNQYGYAMNDKAKGALAHVSADAWLRAHTPNKDFLDQIRHEAGRFDPERFATEDQYPFSMVDFDARVLTGHEGRHRLAAALAENGQDFQVPVVFSSWQGQTPDKWENLGGILGGQPFGQGLDGLRYKGTRLFVPPPVPLNYQFKDDLKRFLEPGVGQRFAKGGLARLAQRLSATSEPKNLARPTVVKEKGGNWLSGSIENELKGLRYNAWNDGPEDMPDDRVFGDLKKQYDALNYFIDKRLTPYVRNELATPGDPVRLLAEQGISHADFEPYGLVGTYKKRMEQGFPREGLAQSPLAVGWEEISDMTIGVKPAGRRVKSGQTTGTGHFSLQERKALENNPWLTKVDPKTPVYDIDEDIIVNLSLEHLMDELRNAVNPESNLPGRLRLSSEQLKNLRMDEAVQHVSEINAWRRNNKRVADKVRANNPATHIIKEYPDTGMKWVQLKTPGSLSPEQTAKYSVVPDGPGFKVRYPEGGSSRRFYTPEEAAQHINGAAGIRMLQDALGYEGEAMKHCVGGYCASVASGDSLIYSLRDAEGLPHVTIEAKAPSETAYEKWFDQMRKLPDNEERGRQHIHFSDWYAEQPEARRSPSHLGMTRREVQDKLFRRYMAERGQHFDEPAPSIIQIKGLNNKEVNKQYVEQVKDFLGSQKWERVNDLDLAGLLEATPSTYTLPKNAGSGWMPRFDELGIEPGYYTNDELVKAIHAARVKRGDPAFAEGGLVDDDDGEGLEDLLDIAGRHYQRFAAGGLVQDDPEGVSDDLMENLLDIAAQKYGQMAPRPAV